MAEKIAALLSRKDYIRNITDWADQQGFAWQLPGSDSDFFDMIKLKSEGKAAIMLVAVSLEGWLENGMQQFGQMQELVGQMRESENECVVLWQDFWERSGRLVQSRLSSMLQRSDTIPGRLTKARRIDQAEAAKFLEANHLNGATNAKFKYGLFLPERYFRVVKNREMLPENQAELLVAVATFSNPRIFEKANQPHKSYELIRFANLTGLNVVGGLDKLLHAFTADRAPDDIMTYADLDWSVGRSYEKLGFEKAGFLEPEQYYLSTKNFERALARRVNNVQSDMIMVRNMGSLKFVKNIPSK